ncbi:hypothetical protein ACFO26_08410 [Lactococcus nasutitermitis]|uniref:Uncharacterized protein n=1 Tax=Lactococcus nasutitermitis TaxID=1652957 RepID=A0ABV9JEK4_9LACT|nr:hypothetical protein [Lactococcus nasutitermitis]
MTTQDMTFWRYAQSFLQEILSRNDYIDFTYYVTLISVEHGWITIGYKSEYQWEVDRQELQTCHILVKEAAALVYHKKLRIRLVQFKKTREHYMADDNLARHGNAASQYMLAYYYRRGGGY